MGEELTAHKLAGTLDMVDLPHEKQVVGIHWVDKVKTKSDVTGSDSEGINSLKTHLNLCFQMKDLGHLRYFLGIEVDRSSEGYFISQVKYASEILNRAGLTDRKAPRTTHFVAVLRILRYIKGTLYQGLQFSSKSELRLHAYTESDWAGDITDRRSTSGYCMFLGNSLISWRSKKQSVVSRSSVEAEYRAMTHTTSEIVWLRWLLGDMGIHLTESTPLYCDNKAAIDIAHNDVFHERTKHIEIDCHFVQRYFKKKTITLPYVSSQFQLADLFTKSLSSPRLKFLASNLKMCFVPS
ncbi:uncharacterized protein LOC113349954 [Papaver somniferum]|uniref:uncharacterized protein LOC113349954 n=1 Tax=Papaver somniferum TaxID=3469 RepID=UPI000E6F9C1D|nr:uncharacterized protein LOC113349954 [Papaver somniferum]